MTGFVRVYDAMTTPMVDWSGFEILGVVAVLCLVFWMRGSTPKSPNDRPPGLFGSPTAVTVLAMVVLLLAGTMAAIQYSGTTRLRNRLRTGSYVLVEGPVENFVPGDAERHREESWQVRSGGRTYTYRYSSSNRVPGFHQSAGLIREEIRVRIADVDGYIARLEIER